MIFLSCDSFSALRSRKVGAALEIIDDYPFDLRLREMLASRSWVSGRSFLRALHEHRDRRSNALLNANHQTLFFVCQEKPRSHGAREDTRLCAS